MVIVRKLGEFKLIETLVGDLKQKGSQVVCGVGDDAAVLKLFDDRYLIVTCDVQIEGKHFTWDRFTKEQVGRRAAVVNLSDIGAMGGRPTFALISLAVPSTLEVDCLTGVYNGIHEFVPRIMKHGEGGHVVTTSSMSGILPTEGGGAGAYTASKFGITGMMEILRSELDAANANIGASVYCPGLVATSIFELEKNLNAAFDEKTAAPEGTEANTEMIKQII